MASSSYLSILHCIHLLLLLLPLLLLPPLTLLLTPQLLTLLLQYSHFYYIQVILLVQQIRRHPDPALRRLGGSHRHGTYLVYCIYCVLYWANMYCTVCSLFTAMYFYILYFIACTVGTTTCTNLSIVLL